MDRYTIGKRIDETIKTKYPHNMSYKKLSELTGIKYYTLIAAVGGFQGRNVPKSIANLLKLSSVLGVSTDYLLGHDINGKDEWISNDNEIICPICGATWSNIDNDTYRFDYCPKCGVRNVP